MILADSNVLLDWLTHDPHWFQWSSTALTQAAHDEGLAINAVIYAEVSVGYVAAADVEQALPPNWFTRREILYEAAFLAGTCFAPYRNRGGVRRSPLRDFFIGAHAVVAGMKLLTRDRARYQTYFPTLQLITP